MMTAQMLMSAAPTNVIPEWVWGLISIVLFVLISLIAYLLRKRDEEKSRAIKDLMTTVNSHSTSISRAWDRLKQFDKRVPTMPTSAEEILRQLQEFRTQTVVKIDQMKDEQRAVERKHAGRLEELGRETEAIKEQLWRQVTQCGSTYVSRVDYRERIQRFELLLSDLQKVATQLEVRISTEKNKTS